MKTLSDFALAQRLATVNQTITALEKERTAIKAEALRRFPQLSQGISCSYFKVSVRELIEVTQEKAWDFLAKNREYRPFFKLGITKVIAEKIPNSGEFIETKKSIALTPLVRADQSESRAA